MIKTSKYIRICMVRAGSLYFIMIYLRQEMLTAFSCFLRIQLNIIKEYQNLQTSFKIFKNQLPDLQLLWFFPSVFFFRCSMFLGQVLASLRLSLSSRRAASETKTGRTREPAAASELSSSEVLDMARFANNNEGNHLWMIYVWIIYESSMKQLCIIWSSLSRNGTLWYLIIIITT